MRKNTLTDFSNSNTLTTYLPKGYNTTSSNSYDLLILVSVSDSLGGITNVTKTVNVAPNLNATIE